ncbi:MAG: zinc metalloprotease [Thermoanaerobaculia bacterium]|nr:zinc metalloprotease [Thermoanaerobaculia bacterium]
MRTPARIRFLLAAALLLCLDASIALAEGPSCQRNVDGLTFESNRALVTSDYFKAAGLRCGTPDREERLAMFGPSTVEGAPADCSDDSTNPDPSYDPGDVYVISVVVHIIMDDSCTTGVISDRMVQSQIDILNQDFLALAGSNGEPGVYSGIRFVLASEDPDGKPTSGITRSCNTTWFDDNGAYWNTLAWDPHRYMNLYTNTADGYLGYVPFLPANGGGAFVGGVADRVVVHWEAFGDMAPGGPPYNLGRTATHEVGHYLGMEHTFNGGCGIAAAPGCYNTGDLVCDTEPEASEHFSPCTDPEKCGDPDPIHNYMDYSDDACMWEFTVEQIRRMRCTLANYRSNLYTVVSADEIFTDGFESGNTSAWSSTSP